MDDETRGTRGTRRGAQTDGGMVEGGETMIHTLGIAGGLLVVGAVVVGMAAWVVFGIIGGEERA